MGFLDTLKSTYATGKAEYEQATEDMNVKSGPPPLFSGITGTGGAAVKGIQALAKLPAGAKLATTGAKIPNAAKMLPGAALVGNTVTSETGVGPSLSFSDLESYVDDNFADDPTEPPAPETEGSPLLLAAALAAVAAVAYVGLTEESHV